MVVKKENTNNKTLEDFLDRKKVAEDSDKMFEAAHLIQKLGNIETNKAYRNVLHRIEKKSRLVILHQQLTKIAAVLFIPVLFVSIWLYLAKNKIIESEKTHYTVQCPVGTKTQLTLPDGSFVWLNSGTTIKYVLPFETKSRQIELNGEAYFDVEKSQVPFVVKSGVSKVKVLGTEFNVKAYETDNKTEVILAEGSVVFSINNQETKLIPNDYLVYSKPNQDIKIKNQNISKYTAWRNNLLLFNQTPLKEVATILERWYGIDVEIKGSNLNKHKFTATFDNEPLLQVIELLELSSPIEFEYIPAKLGKDSILIAKAKIIIRPK